jgi:ComF family protein
MQIYKHYLKKIESWLLPYTCLLCKRSTNSMRDLCNDCEESLPLLNHACLHCAYPMLKNRNCNQCSKQSPSFDTIHALYLYEMPIKQLIHELKFKCVLVNARLLGELLAKQIQKNWYAQKPLPNCIIPIPLHPNRLKERGFNQALEIARPIAKAIKRPIKHKNIQRIKPTFAQATLNLVERHQNVQDAFRVDLDLTHQHIAVIDDVMTTGETVMAFCKTLKQAGAHKIDVWCCARATISTSEFRSL